MEIIIILMESFLILYLTNRKLSFCGFRENDLHFKTQKMTEKALCTTQ